MKGNKKQETEVIQTYKAYFDSYIKGDVGTIAAMLDDDYNQIGSAESEVFFNKKEAMNFLRETIDQVAGKTEIRNRIIKVDPINEIFLVTDLFDIYVWIEEDWSFYAKFRASTLMQKKEDGWKFIHQHSSVPDARTQEGENIAIEKISAENLQLREAIKRRTVELECKNRELQIEAALERVRARTMAMHNSEELDSVASVLFHQLQELDMPNMRRCLIGIVDETNATLQSWYTSMHGDSSHKIISYPISGHPIIEAKIKGWRKQKVFRIELSGEELADLLKYTVSHGFEYPKGEVAATHMVQNHAPFAYGYLEVATHEQITDQDFELLQRFAKVFEQTYTRFLDLQKAEAQAREAQVEVALERVRAKTMGMHSSDELLEIVDLLYTELSYLDVELARVVLLTVNPETLGMHWWMASPEKEIKTHGFLVPPNYLPMTLSMIEAWENKRSDWSYHLEGIDKKKYDKFLFSKSELAQLPEEVQMVMSSAKQMYISGYCNNFGILTTSTLQPLSNTNADLLARFGQVFEQTYTRFLDLQKAESQAREAQIEVALERVRARTMAMHNSQELSDVVSTLYQQIESLGFAKDGCELILCNEKTGLLEYWHTNPVQSAVPECYCVSPKVHNFFKKVWKAWEQNTPGLIIEMRDQEKRKMDIALLEKTDFKRIDKKSKRFILQENMAVFSHSTMKYGLLEAIDRAPLSEDQLIILQRFAKVFEQTYTRFLDLQKAEAQAREAEIQLALERVRARTMAMHKSEELSDTASIMFQELKKLGINSLRTGVCIFDFQNDGAELWLATEDGDKTETKVLGKIYGNMHPMYRKWLDAGAKKKKIFQYKISGNEVAKYYDVANTQLNLPKQSVYNKSEIYTGFLFPEGSINIISLNPLNEDECDIGYRFANVFGLLYRRFLDLQKAEAQAREAQIEAALERVRSRTMALQNSVELLDAASLMFQQLQELKGNLFACGFALVDKNKSNSELWMSAEGKFQPPIVIPNEEPVTHHMFEAWKAGNEFYIEDAGGDALKEHYNYLLSIPNTGQVFQGMLDAGIAFPKWQRWHAAYFTYGYLLIITLEPFEEVDLFKRFAKVFEQTYTRFLDLQKAEAQSREAQIEAALERVRSRSMAMQHSSELNMILAKVFEELTNLELEMERAVIWIYYPENRSVRWWAANPEAESGSESFYIANQDDPVYHEYWKAWEERRTKYLYILEGDYKENWTEILFNKTELGRLPEIVKAAMVKPEKLYLYNTFNDFGVLFISCLEPLSDDKFTILERFGKVFDQSYTRFNDIKQAEAREKEAIKQSSLDRVRAEIASMRTTKDLERITPLIWRELRTLNVPFFRCGVFIMNDENKTAKVYLSTPSGESLAVWNSAYANVPLIQSSAQHWREQKVFRDEWDQKQFIDFTMSLIEQKLIKDPKLYQAGDTAPKHLVLQMVPFDQGMLYVGSDTHLDDDQIELVHALARAFSVAYARYEDFNELENAKNKVEVTLSELKSTQAQLIQAEKMASLGELTAGIAHEIQNPLNFVNNFSEVSGELVDEMNEELDGGNMEEVKAITKDLKQNLEKINHHGQRASSIVKGMLEHSRTGTRQKELTDINILTDEYLRLSYHGLRAKDKFFNADFKVELDPSVPKINVIGQDIGRVLLNLINNAFYAVSEKAKKGIAGYAPQVTVKTKKVDHLIEIRVKDNADGIPPEIVNKIFQPFFTTKPTGSGTGLGLSLSYDIVTMGHNGTLEVDTSLGLGSEFIIQLPA